MLLNNRKQNSQNFVLIFQSTIPQKEELKLTGLLTNYYPCQKMRFGEIRKIN